MITVRGFKIFRFNKKDRYCLDLIEDNKFLVVSLVALFISHMKWHQGKKKITLLCIKKNYGYNVLCIDKAFLRNDIHLISKIKVLQKKDRDIIMQCAFAEACNTERIDEVEVR